MIDVVAAVILQLAHRGQLVRRTDVELWFALAQAREDLSAQAGGAEWIELSDQQRIDQVLQARSWFQAARDAGMVA